MSKQMCLATGGKHSWSYRSDPMLGRVRECNGCGTIQQQQLPSKRWVAIGSTRWVPLTPAEREANAR